MPRTFGAQLQLFRSQPDGRSWQQVELADFSSYGLQSTFFLYGITPTSGSLLPDEPCAVFSSGAHPNLELWFVRFQTAAAPTAVTAVASAAVPQASRLDSARPNPFNASTVVPFEVHAHTQVDLAVYDVLGQRLFTLVHQPMASGRYEARWDGDAAGRILSTGVYTLRLAVGDQVHSRKVTILR